MRIFMSLLLLLLSAAPLHAAVYKCTGAGNKVIYSDSPCNAGDSQTLTDILPGQDTTQQPALAKKPTVILQLDAAVKSAIAADDLTRAEALATTREHWEWIAEARKSAKNAPPQDVADSEECRQAKYDLQREADAVNPQSDVLKAKSSLMYAACGVPEPMELVDEQPAATFFPYPYLIDRRGHPRHSGRHSSYPHKPSGYTSPPYDRRMAEPFGSRFIRPEDAPR